MSCPQEVFQLLSRKETANLVGLTLKVAPIRKSPKVAPGQIRLKPRQPTFWQVLRGQFDYQLGQWTLTCT